jgi:hypothetical protein
MRTRLLESRECGVDRLGLEMSLQRKKKAAREAIDARRVPLAEAQIARLMTVFTDDIE